MDNLGANVYRLQTAVRAEYSGEEVEDEEEEEEEEEEKKKKKNI
jgi:hypothetical protein